MLRIIKFQKTKNNKYNSVGWTGYDDQTRRQLCRKALAEGYTRFKVKVGSDNIEDDRHRLRIVREEIGDDKLLMVDANQKWDVPEAIERMKQLVSFNVLWIEEPTSKSNSKFKKITFIKIYFGLFNQVRMIS